MKYGQSRGFAASPTDTAKPDTLSNTVARKDFQHRPWNLPGFPPFQHISQTAARGTQFAICRHFSQPCQRDFRLAQCTKRVKCCACQGRLRLTHPKLGPCYEKETHVVKRSQKYGACHEKRFFKCYQTRPHVRVCHACHSKRSYLTH